MPEIEYQGVRYEARTDGTWQVTWPSGLRTLTVAMSEETLRQAINVQNEGA